MTRTMYDAAWPPPDPHLDVCAFYIGGDTPHIWTDAEIEGQSARWRLPIYVCDNPGARNSQTDAAQAVSWLNAHHVPQGSALALDYETAVDSTYDVDFDAAIRAAGWTVLLYGSDATVTQNPRPSAGYWTASWTGVPHLDSGASATQWASDTILDKPYDLSEVADSLVLWDTQPAPPPGPPQPEEEDMILLNGFNGPAVYALSGNLLWGVQDGQSVQAYQAAGVKVATITTAEYNSIVNAVAADHAAITLTDAQVAALGAAIAAGIHLPTQLTGTINETLS